MAIACVMRPRDLQHAALLQHRGELHGARGALDGHALEGEGDVVEAAALGSKVKRTSLGGFGWDRCRHDDRWLYIYVSI